MLLSEIYRFRDLDNEYDEIPLVMGSKVPVTTSRADG